MTAIIYGLAMASMLFALFCVTFGQEPRNVIPD